MSSKEENEQPIDHLIMQKTENSESIIISPNTKLVLKEKHDEHDDNLGEQGSTYVKIEIIKQVNENDETLDELYLEEESEKQIALKEDILSLEENNIEPIDYVFVSKRENSESIIINSNIEEELEERFDKLDHNVVRQECIKIEIIKEIDYNEKTSEEIHLEEEREKQKGAKEDVMILEEHRIQSIDYFFLSKTENNKLINNLNTEEKLAEKSDKLDNNVEQQYSIKFKQFKDNAQTFEGTDLKEERETPLIVEKNTIERPKRRSTEIVKSKNSLIHGRNDSLKSITDNVMSCTSACLVDDLKRQSSSGGDLRCQGRKMLNSEGLDQSFESGECAKLSSNKSKLYIGATNEQKFICNKCEKIFTESRDFVSHLTEHSGKKRLKRKSNLVTHSPTHSGVKSYNCNQCSKRFLRPSALVAHIRTHTGEKPYACDQCSKRFRHRSHLLTHIRTHTEEKPYVCDQCSKRLSSQASLAAHIRTHTGDKPYICDQCNKTFNYQRSLVEHIRTHTGEKPYVCDQCSKRFNSHTNLVRHIRTHTGEKSFVCDQCSKTFSLKHQLVNHVRTHTGEKPFACDQCSKRFSLKNHLVTHIRTHTGEKPYACDQCSKRFNQHMHLVTHIRTHTGEKPYACDLCSKRFSLKNNLVIHVRTHTGEKPYVCHQCSKKFNLQNSLFKHIRKHSVEKPYIAISAEKDSIVRTT